MWTLLLLKNTKVLSIDPSLQSLGVAELLEIISAIIKGLKVPVHPEYSSKLLGEILPLHATKGLIDEFTPTVGLYHKVMSATTLLNFQELTYCMVQYVQKDPGNCVLCNFHAMQHLCL